MNWRSWGRRVLAAILVIGSTSLAPRCVAEEWKLDTVHLKNGNQFQGLVDDDGHDYVQIRVVRHHPGRPTVVYSTAVPRADVDRVELADEKDRVLLTERLKALQSERQNWSALLRTIDPAHKGSTAPEFDQVELTPAKWGKGSADGLSYKSNHFRIISNAPREQIAVTAIQLEQVYTAYARLLPPRVDKSEPTTVLLPQSFSDYQALMKDQHKVFLNWAYYDAEHNQIVCPSELQQLAQEWSKKFEANQKELDRLQEELVKLKQLFKGNVPANLLKDNRDQQDRVRQLNEQNRKTCEQQLQKLLQPLYHEAFHAYLNNQVFPTSDYDVPRWLNEGLAQLFETATLEAGELSFDRPDKDRLTLAQAQIRKGDFVSLASLLKADQKSFLAVHNSDKQASDRYYVASWALASYLTFNRKVLGTKALDAYLVSLHRGTDPADAFHELVGMPLKDFEKEFHQAVSRWKPDAFTANSK